LRRLFNSADKTERTIPVIVTKLRKTVVTYKEQEIIVNNKRI